MKNFALLFGIVLPCIVLASDRPPYVGEEYRLITSLSPKEIESLRNGDGMGFAKLAELNHYPGPKHVLDMADRLNMSPSQVDATRLLYIEMKNKAVILGEEILTAELLLDKSFKDGSVTDKTLESTLRDISSIRGQLRYAHLEAHLRQKRLLSADQVSKYDAIRGYRVNEQDPISKHQRHHE